MKNHTVKNNYYPNLNVKITIIYQLAELKPYLTSNFNRPDGSVMFDSCSETQTGKQTGEQAGKHTQKQVNKQKNYLQFYQKTHRCHLWKL